jgi:hypothetical protein
MLQRRCKQAQSTLAVVEEVQDKALLHHLL